MAALYAILKSKVTLTYWINVLGIFTHFDIALLVCMYVCIYIYI